MRTHNLSWILTLLIFGGCVSVNLPTSKPTKSKDVSYQEPGSPFRASHSLNSDKIWESSQTANTISYYSSCSENEPSLKSSLTSSLQGLENFKIISQNNINFNEREAIESVVDGELEGVPVKLKIVVFKKNSCSYHVTYVSLKENFNKEVAQFDKFKSSFLVK